MCVSNFVCGVCECVCLLVCVVCVSGVCEWCVYVCVCV